MKAKCILQILPLLLAFCLAGCSKEDITSTEEAKEYNVSLKFNGEITTADTPLTRSTTTDDLIGMQVYQDGKAWRAYLLNSIENLKIPLHSNKSYKFVVTIVKDGQNILSNNTDPFYNMTRPSSNYIYIHDGMDYGASFKKGYTKMKDGRYDDYPETDRFYGELDNYTPTENGSVAIDLKRTAFGLKYEVSGITDGTVSVKIKNTSRTFFENTSITADYASEEKIFTFSDVYSAWKYAANYTESITISASWARGVGITENLGSKTVQIKRNAMNIIRLKLGSVDYDGNIGIEVEEETDMNEENVTGTLE